MVYMLYGKDFVNTHSKEFSKILETEIKNLLKPDEILLSLTFSSNKHSYYVTLLNTESHQWITFRLSDHKRKGTLKSLYSVYYDRYRDVESMMNSIKQYLKSAAWTYFSYHHYFVLKSVRSIPHHRSKILVKIPKGDYKHFKHKVTFEQEINEGKIFIEVNDIDKYTQKILRSLYVQNLLASELYEHTRKSVVYVRNSGIKLLERFDSLYYQKYEDDFSETLYENFKVPEKLNIQSDKDNEILLQMENIKAFSQYYVYGLLDNEQNALLYIGYHQGNLTAQDIDKIPVIKSHKQSKAYIENSSHITPVVFMTDITEREAQITVKTMLNQYTVFSPVNYGGVVSYNQMYNYTNGFQVDNDEINAKIYGDFNTIQHHTDIQYIDINELGHYNILIVKLRIDSKENNIPASLTYSTTSKTIKKEIVTRLEISEKVAKKVNYIIGIHPCDGRVVAVYKVNKNKKRYMKFKNDSGKYKYMFNFFAITEKVSTINNIKLVKTTNTVLTNYQFVDQNGKMKRSVRRVVFV